MTEKVQIYEQGKLYFSNKESAIALANSSSFGELKEGKVIYSIYEVLYLLEKNKAEVLNLKDKKIPFKEMSKKLKKEKEHQNYLVFKDLRTKGRIVKEGLKFGTDFRVYEKDQKPGINHAKYLVYVADSKILNLKDFCAKARIANSTKKSLLLAIPDNEGDINYYDINWKSLN